MATIKKPTTGITPVDNVTDLEKLLTTAKDATTPATKKTDATTLIKTQTSKTVEVATAIKKPVTPAKKTVTKKVAVAPLAKTTTIKKEEVTTTSKKAAAPVKTTTTTSKTKSSIALKKAARVTKAKRDAKAVSDRKQALMEIEMKLEGKIPEFFNIPSSTKREVIYVFQGGGALGAYQVGAFEALYEHGYVADMIVGISIGGINSAILAGNRPEHRLQKICEFWDRITTKMPFPMMANLGFSKVHHWISAQSSILFGQPGFYIPKAISPLLTPDTTPDQLSYYDTTPLRETLLELIDFKYLNEKHMRLCLGSVDLETGEFVFFDNFEREITVDHVLASGALPPGFPPIQIDGHYYVDGGVFSNTPLSKVIDEFADSEKHIRNVLCFMVDLFSLKGPLPHSLDGLMERVKDIRYSSHAKRGNSLYATTQNLSHAIHFLASKLTPEQRKDPKVQEVLKLGYAHRLDIIHLIYHSEKGTELESKDYEFSAESANKHRKQGYLSTKKMIEQEESEWMKKHHSGVTLYTLESEKTLSTKI